MLRFASARALCFLASTALVPLNANAQDLDLSVWLHRAFAQSSEARQAPFALSLSPSLSTAIGNATVAGVGLSVVGALALRQTEQVSGGGGKPVAKCASRGRLPRHDARGLWH